MNAELPTIIDEGADYFPRNPTTLSWPATLPVELALRIDTPKAICETYGIDRDEWLRLIANPRFRADVAAASELIRKEGMSFKLKAGLLAENFLPNIYNMVNGSDEKYPASVKADLIKFVVKAAGYDASKDQGKANVNIGVGFSIRMDLSR